MAYRIFACFLVAMVGAYMENTCPIRNCTQNPRDGMHEETFYCTIRHQDGCNELKKKFPTPDHGCGMTQSDTFHAVWTRFSIHYFKDHAALNLTVSLPVLDKPVDVPPTEALTMELGSHQDEAYQKPICRLFEFTPQIAQARTSPREINYCNFTGLSPGSLTARATPYYLRISLFPTGSRVTYYFTYQGMTHNEAARMYKNMAAVWEPVIAAAVWPCRHSIHAVVESPPPEFGVLAVNIAVFTEGGQGEAGHFQRSKRLIIPNHEMYHLNYEFTDLPVGKYSVKVTPECRNPSRCRVSLPQLFHLDVGSSVKVDPVRVPDFPPHQVLAGSIVALVLSAIVVFSITCFILRRKRRRRGSVPPAGLPNLVLVFSKVEKSLEGVASAFVKLFQDVLDFEVTRIDCVENTDKESCLQSHLQDARVVILVCLPHPELPRSPGWSPKILNLLENDPVHMKKCILGCLRSGTEMHPHLPLSGGETVDGGEDSELQPLTTCQNAAFPQMDEAIKSHCHSLGEMEKNFHEFYLDILHTANLPEHHRRNGYRDYDEWRELILKICQSAPAGEGARRSSENSSLSPSSDASGSEDESSDASSDSSSSCATNPDGAVGRQEAEESQSSSSSVVSLGVSPQLDRSPSQHQMEPGRNGDSFQNPRLAQVTSGWPHTPTVYLPQAQNDNGHDGFAFNGQPCRPADLDPKGHHWNMSNGGGGHSHFMQQNTSAVPWPSCGAAASSVQRGHRCGPGCSNGSVGHESYMPTGGRNVLCSGSHLEGMPSHSMACGQPASPLCPYYTLAQRGQCGSHPQNGRINGYSDPLFHPSTVESHATCRHPVPCQMACGGNTRCSCGNPTCPNFQRWNGGTHEQNVVYTVPWNGYHGNQSYPKQGHTKPPCAGGCQCCQTGGVTYSVPC